MLRFAKLVAIVATVGGLVGYAIALAEIQGLYLAPYELLFGYSATAFPVAAAAIMLVMRAFKDDFAMNQPDSLARVLEYAPMWSKAIAGAGFFLAFGGAILLFGGSVHVSIDDWPTAPATTRAMFFVAFAVPWVAVLPGAMAVHKRCAA